MAYCKFGDVAAEFKDHTFTTETVVTPATIDGWIAQADAYIDSKVGKQFTVPVTAATAVLLLKTISIYKVAHRVGKAMEIRTGASDSDQDDEKTFDEMAEDMLTGILEKKIDLEALGAGRISSDGGISDHSYANDIEAEFDVTTDNW